MSSKNTRDDRFFETLRKRFALAEEALADIHREAIRDFEFRAGDAWDKNVEAKRKEQGKACFSVNRIPQFIRQVAGEQKKNRPAVQIAPVGDGADVETAEIEQGLVRHIERTSNAKEAYDTAFEHMLTGGFGFIRLVTDYCDYESFDQDICIRREVDPFAHYPDPTSKEPDYSDARYWFVIDVMQREDFEAEYPDSEVSGSVDFESLAAQAPGWIQQDSVRVAEYFWIETTRETRRKTVNGRTLERDVQKKTVHWCKTNGVEILEERDIPGEWIPIVPVLGEEIRINGKRLLIGLVRFARTPMQLYNLWQSAMAEAIALAPKAPFLATPKQIEGYEDIWESANQDNYPYLPVNPDKDAPGWPQRQFSEPPIQAITSAIAHADNDLKTTTGLYDPSLGAPGPEQSGKAILLRQKQGDTASYGFVDAMSRAIRHVGRIILGWIPHYYDAARVIRVVNPDGSSDTVQINQHFQDDAGLLKIFDLTVGKYDVSVSTGPSYESAREEAAQSILQLVQAQPELMQVVGDLLVKCFDWPMAQEISDRLKKMLPAPLQDQQGADAIPPQVQAHMAQQQQVIEHLTQVAQQLLQEKQGKVLESASRERVALIQAKAGLIEAAMKAKSAEAKIMFDADIAQIDRMLQLHSDNQDRQLQQQQMQQPAQQGGDDSVPAPAAAA